MALPVNKSVLEAVSSSRAALSAADQLTRHNATFSTQCQLLTHQIIMHPGNSNSADIITYTHRGEQNRLRVCAPSQNRAGKLLPWEKSDWRRPFSTKIGSMEMISLVLRIS